MKAGAADVQLCGTDSTPSEAARPTPVDTAAFPISAVLNMPIPGPAPPLSADPKSCIWLPNMFAAGLREFMNEFAELSIEAPSVPIDADDPAPDAKLVAEFVPEVRPVDAEPRPNADDSGKVDDDEDVVKAVDAKTPDSALGAAAPELSGVVVTAELSGVENKVSWADTAEASGATVWAQVPAEVLAAWPTAAACPAAAVELVVGGGTDHGLSTDAACAKPW